MTHTMGPRIGGPMRQAAIGFVFVLLAAVPTAGAAQSPLRPLEVHTQSAVPPDDLDFGGRVAARGTVVVASGSTPGGVAEMAFWKRSGGAWTRTSIPGPFPGFDAAPVATDGVSVYRAIPASPSGLTLQSLSTAGIGATASGATVGPRGLVWETVYASGQTSTEADGLAATVLAFGNFAIGPALAVTWRDLQTSPLQAQSHLVILANLGALWAVEHSLTLPQAGALQVAIDDHRLALGIPGLDQVQVYERVPSPSSSTWQLRSTLFAPPNAIGFGESVALSGSRLAVGAPRTELCVVPPTIGCGPRGQVYFFERQGGGSWVAAGSLLSGLEGVPIDAELGTSVALSEDGSRLAVGAPGWPHDEAEGGAAGQGAVLVAHEPAGASPLWRQTALATSAPPELDRLGAAVAWADDDLFGGAPQHLVAGRISGAMLRFSEEIFSDGFASGDVSAWSQSTP
ncbi:MAG: hypothetical protein DWQ36_01790 [Acidobacteria bacterium]|nr:MAG: hypothetical protein DWQ30_16635 [Acidobacteriota bacterium]REK11503.1 MAG: hypothetical protein DWQ36_01790 [Acidobacteriota bacterium]